VHDAVERAACVAASQLATLRMTQGLGGAGADEEYAEDHSLLFIKWM